MRAVVIGAGVAGLSCALELAERGAGVEVFERSARLGAGGCSWFAGGMLAPWCELEYCDPLIAHLGAEAIPWWQARVPGTLAHGTLIVAHARDTPALTQFNARISARGGHCEALTRAGLATLEPHLAGRFERALWLKGEAHLDPRAALGALASRLAGLGVPIRFGVEAVAEDFPGRAVIDCTGLAARGHFADLRGVKGEMLLLHQPEVSLNRPVRLLHPRMPLYVVPRGEGMFMVGATMIESDEGTRVSARSMLELLSAAYALHPAFGEAQILEMGTGVRPAFPDNLPRLERSGETLYVNGLYRHGFLLAPALARRAAEAVVKGSDFPEVIRADSRQRLLA